MEFCWWNVIIFKIFKSGIFLEERITFKIFQNGIWIQGLVSRIE